MHDVQSAADILSAAQAGLKVRRLIGHHVYEGVARGIGTENGTFGPSDADIRSLYLRVTDWGSDYYWPVSELINDHQALTFVVER